MKRALLSLFTVLMVTAASAETVTPPETEIQPPRPAAQPQDADALEEEWEAMKARYRDKFKAALDAQEKRIEELEHELDNGDRAKRDAIAQEVSEARKHRVRLKRRHDELKAAGIVSLANLKNRMTDWVKKEP
jgi:hypothetical protein